jgi:mono/diheme cytochrome c family protein/glucose/arabinose dehydrogenase
MMIFCGTKELKTKGYFLLALLVFGCRTSYEEPKIPLDEYQLEDGFTLQVVASEPHLKAPVAIDFDTKGRIWVTQMPGYMNDMQGSDETKPVGNIKILEDLDGDGVVDHSKIFLDSLVMPRALAHVYGGLLYAEPPKLWFVEIEDDKPVHKVLVDSIYAAEGNPEHQPNGLLLNIDNWIYNAKSNFRYRRKNGVWEKEPTTFRGQWGISNDNFGRLYYNDNSRQLLGDHVLPNRMVRNQYFTPKVAVDQMLTRDQRVYPLHATTVNRGYAPSVLNKDSILVNATAACGPLVYRGGTFPEEYEQNVFVCIPEGNLIKRNILRFIGDSTIAEQAWEGKEFLASTDEGFRPVNLNNGPDGSMYVVDMHRGMIGHHAYLSPYLKQKVKGNQLDTLINFGRILKVQNEKSKAEPYPNFETLNAQQLVLLLRHHNGWIRNRAQHYLIFKKKREAIESLKNLVLQQENPLTKIHALYTLEGLDALSFDFLVDAAKKSSADVVIHAVVLLEPFVSKENSGDAELLFKDLTGRGNSSIDLYIGSSLGVWMTVDRERFFPQMVMLLNRYPNKPIFHEAILSGLAGNELYVKESLAALANSDDRQFTSLLTRSIEQRAKETTNPIFTRAALAEDNRTHGAKMFFEICASCHGINGQGIQGLAPPLMNSEHVADAERLGLIVLHGLEGPIDVNGEYYDFNLAMPGLIRNENITDKDIADIISYVTNAFSDVPKALADEKVEELRNTKSRSGSEYTMEELLEYSKK